MYVNVGNVKLQWVLTKPLSSEKFLSVLCNCKQKIISFWLIVGPYKLSQEFMLGLNLYYNVCKNICSTGFFSMFESHYVAQQKIYFYYCVPCLSIKSPSLKYCGRQRNRNRQKRTVLRKDLFPCDHSRTLDTCTMYLFPKLFYCVPFTASENTEHRQQHANVSYRDRLLFVYWLPIPNMSWCL